MIYRTFRGFLKYCINPYLRLRAVNERVLDLPGPTILAPVHRSNLDSILLASVSKRRIRALGKESLFEVPVLGYFCAALGAIPVKRGAADRDAMKAAKAMLLAGETMIVFPEGGRQEGNQIGELFDGVAWLAAYTGARVIPVGIAGTADALPSGAKWLRRSKVTIVAGESTRLQPEGKRATRAELQNFTSALKQALQAAQTEATNRK